MYLTPIISQHLGIVWGLCTKNDITQKFWAQLISVMVCSLHKSPVNEGQDLSGCERFTFNFLYHFKVRTYFFCSFTQRTYQTTYIQLHSMKRTSKVQSEHTQSLHYMNIRKFFTCLNCIPPIKFYFATVDSITCYFLVNNLHFITYFTHKEQSTDRQQTIKESALI